MMELSQLNRVIACSAVVTLIVGVSMWCWEPLPGRGFLFGGIWNTINLWVLKQLFVSIFDTPRLSMLTLFWLTIKIPLLYGTGAVILLTVPLSAGAGILGFHVPFAVLLMAALYYQKKACNPAHLPIEFQTTQRDGKR
jgi:hypothetical protein